MQRRNNLTTQPGTVVSVPSDAVITENVGDFERGDAQKTSEQLSGLNINDVLTKVLGVQHGAYKPVYNEYNQEIARKYANDNDVYVHQNRVARLPADPDFPKRLEYKEYIVHRDYYKIEQKTDDYQTYVLRDGNNLTVRYVYSE